MTTNRRDARFIDPEIQGALARRIATHWCLYTLLAATLVVGLKWMSNPFQPFLQHVTEAWWTYGPVLVVLAFMAPLFVYDSVRLSNRFAGPIRRIRGAARSLADGRRPGKIHMRENDFWGEFAADFNRVIDRVDPVESADESASHD